MEKKFVTVMVVGDRKGRLRKFVLSQSVVKLIAAGCVIGAVLFSAILVDYLNLVSQSIENKRLYAENSELRAQFQVVEGKLSNMEKAMERIRTFSTKLKMITAVNDPDRGLNLAMGPLTRTASATAELEDLPDERVPASSVVDEPVFKPKNIALMVDSELAREDDRDYERLSIRLDHVLKVSRLREQTMIELWEQLQDRSSLLAATPSIKPVRGWYTSRFGYRVSPYTDAPMMHEGLDIAANPGTPVSAPAEGIVSFVGYDSGYGKLIILDHGYGVETRYGHNSQVFVSAGQKVKLGDRISAVGTTGRSTGPHLHYEVRVNGEPVDPEKYILED